MPSSSPEHDFWEMYIFVRPHKLLVVRITSNTEVRRWA